MIAFIDLETTGLDHTKHEICDVGIYLVDAVHAQVEDIFSEKVRIEHPEYIEQAARQKNGYNEEEWKNAMPLTVAMRLVDDRLRRSKVVGGYNIIPMDRRFLWMAYRKVNLPRPPHIRFFDLYPMARRRLKKRDPRPENYQLSTVAQFLGLEPEPAIHRARNGARLAFEVWKKFHLAGI